MTKYHVVYEFESNSNVEVAKMVAEMNAVVKSYSDSGRIKNARFEVPYFKVLDRWLTKLGWGPTRIGKPRKLLPVLGDGSI